MKTLNKDEANFNSRLESCSNILPRELQHETVLSLIRSSLAEDLHPSGFEASTNDLSQYDLTSTATLPADQKMVGKVFTRKSGVIAGLPLMASVFMIVDPQIEITYEVSDGARVERGHNIAWATGRGRSLLSAERTAINFLGRLSGIATLTRTFVEAVSHTNAIILDTRKTAPGYRLLDKYAVRMGGGENHRMGLYDIVLIKNNHIDGAGGIQPAVEHVREQHGDRYLIEVEVRTLDELKEALSVTPSRIMLDNMDLETMRQAVELSNSSVPLEASGNVTIDTVVSIAETGVDYISVGSLTHSAPVLDISMHVEVSKKME